MPHTPVARAYDSTAEIYEQARPGWPMAAVEHVARELELEPTATILDLGAGTGKLTRVLAERFDRVVAVEPLDGMRRVLESVVPAAEALAGEAEAIPLPNASVDAVFSADAFHWFDGERALAEIARVLRPRGGLVLLWNVTDKPTEPSIGAAGELVNKLGSPERQVRRYDSGEWREPFADSLFEELREARFDNPQVVDREGMVAYLASMSWIAVLPDRERTDLLGQVRGLLDAETYTRFWRTEVNWTRLAG
jgi:ubiquinone/menaquinone biosynthesis C-methylase UbiE